MKNHSLLVFAASGIASIAVFSTGCRFGGADDAPPEVKNGSAAISRKDIELAKRLHAGEHFALAFQIFKKYADMGDAEGEAWLGHCYMNGIGVERDPKKAFELFTRSAAKNDPWGTNGLAICREIGCGTKPDRRGAMEMYLKAAELGNPLAALNLAKLRMDRNGDFFDIAEAERWFKKALEMNAPGAKAAYAQFLYRQKRYPEAIALFRQTLNEPSSLEGLAMCLQNGWGVSVNIPEAVKLAEEHYRRFGASRWSSELCCNAGHEELLVNGNTDFAKRCFKAAADQGNAEAQFLYAGMLKKSGGNDREVLLSMTRAAENGIPQAAIAAAEIFAAQKKYPSAIRYYTLATLDNLTAPQAVKALADIYDRVLAEPQKALAWNHFGAAMGIGECRNRIAMTELEKPGDEHLARGAALLAEGVAGNDREAVKLLYERVLPQKYTRLRELADADNAEALFTLGVIGCREQAGHPNIQVGIELLERSANLKSGIACRVLGDLYFEGKVVPQDLRKALQWYALGMSRNDRVSAGRTAWLLNHREKFRPVSARGDDIEPKSELSVGRPGDYDSICRAFKTALKLKEYSVAFEYGELEETSAKNIARAIELYQLAADHNDTRAMRRLYGLLQKTNPVLAIAFLHRAIRQNDPAALIDMAKISEAEQNPRKAYICYLRAVQLGDRSEAAYGLARCYLNGYGCKADVGAFLKYAELAYNNNHAEVCHLVGTAIRAGRVRNPKRKADEYFAEGARRGSEACRRELERAKGKAPAAK